MFNRINTTASALALLAYSPEGETTTASNGVTLAKVASAAPRILPDLSQAKPAAKVATAKPGKVATKGVAKQHAANVVAASNKVRRLSRVAPICGVIAKLMDKGPQHVATMAKRAECSEREIRLAIDKLRAMKWRIDRTAIKTFGYAPKFKRPAKLDF